MNRNFIIKCGNCGKERELNIGSVADSGSITIRKIGDRENGDVEKIYINCSCENWIEFDRF